ncbi:MAG: hypothetical protein GY787_16765 [Alteromonadales bacterium]|nr:hypothetical protein [Alteromonadales bacterium]
MTLISRYCLLSCLLYAVPAVSNEAIDAIDALGSIDVLSAEQNESLKSNLKKIEGYYDNIKKVSHQITTEDKSVSVQKREAEIEQSPVEHEANTASIKQSNRARGPRDPFAITTRMFGYRAPKDVGYDFSPVLDVKVPEIQLKAVIRGPSGQLAALIDVEGQSGIVVREGDTIGLEAGQSGHGLRIKKINRSSLVLTTGSLGGDVIVR